MLPPWFAVAVLILNIPLVAGAALQAWRGTFQPNPVTWALWTIAPLIGAAAAWSEGAGLSAAATLAVGIGPAFVLGASLLGPHRATRWPVTVPDLYCAAVAAAALMGWWITGSGLVAVVLSIVADAAAGVPTVLKAWHHPRTESPLGYVAGLFSGLAGLATLEAWDPSGWLFPAYLVALFTLLTVLVLTPGRVPDVAA